MSERMARLDAKLNGVAVEAVGKSAPLIGITPTGSKGGSIGKQYVQAVMRAGGIPVVLAADTTAEYLQGVVSRLDGILLTGGEDVAPSYYGEDAVEQLGKVVFLVEGDEENLKITTPTDLILAEAILRDREDRA